MGEGRYRKYKVRGAGFMEASLLGIEDEQDRGYYKNTSHPTHASLELREGSLRRGATVDQQRLYIEDSGGFIPSEKAMILAERGRCREHSPRSPPASAVMIVCPTSPGDGVQPHVPNLFIPAASKPAINHALPCRPVCDYTANRGICLIPTQK